MKSKTPIIENFMKKVALGIDIGGTNTDIALVDRDGNFLAEDRMSTSNFPQPEVFVAALAEKVKLLKKTIFYCIPFCVISVNSQQSDIGYYKSRQLVKREIQQRKYPSILIYLWG